MTVSYTHLDVYKRQNPIMVDGTGMCGACRLIVGGEVKFACVDGPEFDGHQVDFDQAMKRLSLIHISTSSSPLWAATVWRWLSCARLTTRST